MSTADPAPLFIASREAIPHDEKKRRILAFGRAKGGSVIPPVTARFGDHQATGTRKQEPGKAEATEAS